MSSNEISPNKGQGSSFSNRGSSRFSSRGTMNNKKSTPARPRVDENGLIIPPYHILKKGERDDPVKKRKELEESKFLQAWKEFQGLQFRDNEISRQKHMNNIRHSTMGTQKYMYRHIKGVIKTEKIEMLQQQKLWEGIELYQKGGICFKIYLKKST